MTPQQWDPERYARAAGFVPELGRPVVDLMAPCPGECVLDLGCGDGVLTHALVDAGCTVVGVDLSAEQVAAAQARGLDARVADARALTFAGEFDAVLSNAVLHWIPDLDAVMAGVRRSLRPGGRFVGEMGGEGNVAAVCDALFAALAARDVGAAAVFPWIYPSVEDFHVRLERHGFRVRAIELFDRPTPLPGPLGDWLDTFAEPFLAAVDATERAAVKAHVETLAAPRLRSDSGGWFVDYVRLRWAADAVD